MVLRKTERLDHFFSEIVLTLVCTLKWHISGMEAAIAMIQVQF